MSTFNHGPESRVRGAKNLPRYQLRIATLNVRTLTQAGSLEALKMDLAQYKLDILGVQETRLQEQEIDLGDHKLYLSDSWLSGVKSRQGGVGVAVKKSLISSIVEQVALSERICYVKFAARRRANLAVVVCYAPTNEASLQEKDLFWSQLSDLVYSFKHRERICVIGDLNAEPGYQLNDTMSCRGPFGMGEENENSEKLLSFCTSHKLLVGGTWFQHRQVHRYTYNPPDPSCRKKMLDHILFAERYRGCLTNVRTRRGKTTITDHELVIAEVSMKLLSKKPCFTPRISSAKLQDETTRDLFTQEVKLHLDKSGDFENTEQSWDNFRKALNQAAVKCLLPDKRVNKPWISPDSLELIRKRADLQLKKHSSAVALLEFTNCCKEVRKALRADKRAWLERKGQEVQSFADRGNLKEVFGAAQQICRNWSPQLTKLVSSTGVNLRTKEERLERWTEHFSQLLNPSTSTCSTRLDPEEAAESLSVDLSPIRFEEVLEAVRRLKNGLASGPDNISCEMLKAHKGIVEWLWDIIDKCWSTEVLPDDWKVAEIVPLYKSKGKRSECSNHRGISLLSVPGKVFASVILNRCKDSVDRVLREEQCGFRKSRGCADQLFALLQIIEKSMAFQLDISFCFIDFRAAFDSVDREQMFSCKVQDVLGNEFENIEAFKYLGSYVSLKHGDLQEVNCKPAEGRQRFANFQNLWKSKQLSVHLKCNLYKALVLSAVLYSSETWTLSKLMERKLESFHCGWLRRILRVSYLEKATNEEIMSRSRMPQLFVMIMLKRIKWYGHIQRMEPGRLARSAFDWDPPDLYVHARRAPGGQRKTWMSQIEGDCVRNKVSFTRLQEKAATGSKNAFNNFVVQHFTE